MRIGTKSHRVHRKVTINKIFRRSAKIRRLCWNVFEICDKVVKEREKRVKVSMTGSADGLCFPF